MDKHLENITEAFQSLQPKTEPNNNEDNKENKEDPCACTLHDQSNSFDDREDSEESAEEKKYDILECKSMTRLSHILSYYAAWIKNKQSLNEIYEETTAQNDGDRDIHMFEVMNSGKYLGSYNNSKLLNDFHHIVERHHYHTIQQLLVSCGASDGCYMESDLCQLLVRNYRNRNSGATHEEKQEEYRCGLYFGYATSTEVATQQILDAIHCFVYHSYDLGHTLTASQLYLLNNHEREDKHQNSIYSP
eukprot:329066_1